MDIGKLLQYGLANHIQILELYPEEWLQASWSGEPGDFAEESHALLAQVCDEMHATATVTDETWARVRERYDDAQIVEIVFMVGYYHLVSYVARMFELAPEPWAATPPAR